MAGRPPRRRRRLRRSEGLRGAVFHSGRRPARADRPAGARQGSLNERIVRHGGQHSGTQTYELVGENGVRWQGDGLGNVVFCAPCAFRSRKTRRWLGSGSFLFPEPMCPVGRRALKSC
jgi:hypothetical protein